ncbi:MAG TPA: HAD-IC family P-type ATPase [Candidatus Saccharimonas sp.]|nr:HAD-IC family P-type ATPase [Candidatus Saccharimonas sp.]
MDELINQHGLTTEQVIERTAAGQINRVHDRTSRSIGDIVRTNIFTRFNLLLGVLTVVVLAVGSPTDALFGLVIIFNSAIGVVQEIRAKQTLDKLAFVTTPMADVLRDGATKRIAAADIVLGDVIHINSGDEVPADAKILSSDGLEVDESLLTGESEPVTKKPGTAVLSGSIAVAGHALAQTTAVGAQAYAHQLAAKVKKFSIARSELIDATNKLLKYISWLIVLVAPLMVLGQLHSNGGDWHEALVRATAAIVGMVPEGLVLLTSLAFALAIITLARRQVLVQQLPAVEGLARVDVICLDKTGTLTERDIVFEELSLLPGAKKSEVASVLATFAATPNSATLKALHIAFNQKPLTTKATVAFSSARKWSAVSVSDTAHWVMGAPEVLLGKTDAAREQAAKIATTGKRVLLLATTTKMPTSATAPQNLKPAALLILGEKIRSDAKQTLHFFAEQGVIINILSGDNPHTVGAVAAEVGVAGKAFDARNLPTDHIALANLLQTTHIFGRVTPEQKRAIIKALQAKGHVVAMTGDGVNDALALKDADIGIAMGNAAPATKGIAEIVLLDSQFARLPAVLAEGRRVIANIERVANLFVIKNVYSLLLAIGVTLLAVPFPFLPRHLTIISALTIGIPAFFLALAPNNQRYRPGFLKRVLGFALPAGAVIALGVGAIYAFLQLGVVGGISTGCSLVIVVIGTWILFRLAQPFNWWKLLLVALVPISFGALLFSPAASTILDFAVTAPILRYSLIIGAVGAVLTEIVWQLSHARQSRHN